MDTLAMMPVEIQATLAAALVVALISALQILDLRRAKKEFSRKSQELLNSLAEGSSSCDMKKCGMKSKFSLMLQFIFGFIVFALLSCWAFFLIKEGLIGTALFSGIFALLGIFMPFYIWASCKKEAKEMEQLIKEIESRPITGTGQEDLAMSEESTVAQIKEIVEDPVISQKTVAEFSPEAEIKPTPIVSAVASEPGKKIEHIEVIPEDSMLRRHHYTYMASLKQQSSVQDFTPTLQTEPVIVAETKASAEIVATQSPVSSKKERLPEDTMLRRHYMSALRTKIEASFPQRPTDSILKRHYDGWKNYLVECQISKCIKELDA